LEESICNLKSNAVLEDLYLTGNPCEQWAGFRAYTIAHLPQLKQLDGQLILPHDRIQARGRLHLLQEELDREKLSATQTKKERLGSYTKESRDEMYLELAAQKEEKERRDRHRMGLEPKIPRNIPGVWNDRGEIRQCNEGKYNFKLDDAGDPAKIVFELGVPKYLDTTAMEVDVNPWYVRCVVKEKVTQLKLPAEVCPDSSVVQRSRITGVLRIEMPLLTPRTSIQPRKVSSHELKALTPEDKKMPTKRSAEEKTSIYNICKNSERTELLKEVTSTTTRGCEYSHDHDGEDDDGIPPLDVVQCK